VKARKLSYADDTVVNRELIEPLKLSNTFLGTLDNFDRLFLLLSLCYQINTE